MEKPAKLSKHGYARALPEKIVKTIHHAPFPLVTSAFAATLRRATRQGLGVHSKRVRGFRKETFGVSFAVAEHETTADMDVAGKCMRQQLAD